MNTVISFFHTNSGIAVIAAMAMLSGYIIGFHSGNRFRVIRLKLRDPKEIRKRIEILKKDLSEAECRYRDQKEKNTCNVDLINLYQHQVIRTKSILKELEWVMNNND